MNIDANMPANNLSSEYDMEADAVSVDAFFEKLRQAKAEGEGLRGFLQVEVETLDESQFLAIFERFDAGDQEDTFSEFLEFVLAVEEGGQLAFAAADRALDALIKTRALRAASLKVVREVAKVHDREDIDGKIASQLETIRRQEFEAIFRSGKALFDKRDFGGARDHLLRLLREQPNHAGAVFLVGQIALAQKENEVALDYLTQARDLSPDLVSRHIELGRIQKRVKQFVAAANSFNEAVKLGCDRKPIALEAIDCAERCSYDCTVSEAARLLFDGEPSSSKRGRSLARALLAEGREQEILDLSEDLGLIGRLVKAQLLMEHDDLEGARKQFQTISLVELSFASSGELWSAFEIAVALEQQETWQEILILLLEAARKEKKTDLSVFEKAAGLAKSQKVVDALVGALSRMHGSNGAKFLRGIEASLKNRADPFEEHVFRRTPLKDQRVDALLLASVIDKKDSLMALVKTAMAENRQALAMANNVRLSSLHANSIEPKIFQTLIDLQQTRDREQAVKRAEALSDEKFNAPTATLNGRVQLTAANKLYLSKAVRSLIAAAPGNGSLKVHARKFLSALGLLDLGGVMSPSGEIDVGAADALVNRFPGPATEGYSVFFLAASEEGGSLSDVFNALDDCDSVAMLDPEHVSSAPSASAWVCLIPKFYPDTDQRVRLLMDNFNPLTQAAVWVDSAKLHPQGWVRGSEKCILLRRSLLQQAPAHFRELGHFISRFCEPQIFSDELLKVKQ